MLPARLLPLIGTVAVLYLIALTAQEPSAVGYGLQAVVAVLVALSVLAPPLLHRDQSDPRATVLVRWLGVLGALAGVGVLVAPGMLMSIDVIAALATSAFGAMLPALALVLPERARVSRRSPWIVVVPWLFACVPAAISLAATFGPVELGPFGTVLLNDRAVLAPIVFAVAAAVPALWLQIGRVRGASDADARATAGWLAATLGVGIAGMIAIASLRATGLVGESVLVAAGPLVVLLVVLGHVRALDPGLARLAAPAVRRGLAVIVLGSLALGGTLLARRTGLLSLPPGWTALELALGGGAIAVVCGLLTEPLSRAFDRWLSPFEGQLLDALRALDDELPGGGGIDGIARAVLRAMRRASGDVGAAPWLWTVSPDVEMGLDAAGEPHATGRAMPALLRQVLDEKLRGESTLPDDVFRHGVLLRRQLERDSVRRAELRPVAAALVAIDAAAIVPLVSEGMLEGAIALPRGMRATPLAFEEIEALERLGRRVCPLVATLAAEARAMARGLDATRRADELEEALGRGQDKMASLERELSRLRAGPATDEIDLERGAVIAYSRPMRDLLASVRAAAPLDVPVTLVARAGTGATRIARRLHEEGGRAGEPFLVVDCAAHPVERTAALLAGERAELGGAVVETPGWLETSGAGTLVLDAPTALSRAAQDALSDALASREVRPEGGVGAVPVFARVVVVVRDAPDALAARDGLSPALAERLSALVLRVPTLVERRDDLGALVLLALDRACRVLGRETIGIEEGAMDVLAAHDWPGNLPELAQVIERAAARSEGPRLTRADLDLAGPTPAQDDFAVELDAMEPNASPSMGPAAGAEPVAPTPSDPPTAPDGGTYEELERRILAEALWRASGNKSEAARALGLKRTTFQDKLRRYGLLGSDGEPRAKRSEPPN
ncbi:MAG: sigma-54-dependent Fis family transcriptional regulator [Deltaproteobacteria bacterium]|nr:sigma-54-dependent Fis family transcriptional regulator [Deltaproteobacteria bacterium]